MDAMTIFKYMFTNPKEYEKITAFDKEKAYFFINERMSRGFPLQSNLFNVNKINQSAVVDMWQTLVCSKFNSMPTWATSHIKTKDNSFDFQSDVFKSFLVENRIGKRDFIDALKVNENKTLQEYKEYERIYNS